MGTLVFLSGEMYEPQRLKCTTSSQFTWKVLDLMAIFPYLKMEIVTVLSMCMYKVQQLFLTAEEHGIVNHSSPPTTFIPRVSFKYNLYDPFFLTLGNVIV